MVRLSAHVLLLLLTCLTGCSASETELPGIVEDTAYGPSTMEISGVDIVTVNIPYGFECSANCYPGCQFTWTRDNVTFQGPELTLELQHLVPMQTLTCTAVNPTTGRSATIQKTLHVTEGPSNIQINGPPMMTYGETSVFTCTANCYPSCSYSWTVVLEGEEYSTAEGSSISVTPPASTVSSETLICQAENTVSNLFISTTLNLWVASQSGISIEGDSTVTIGRQYTFLCFATCIPSCTFTWTYMGITLQGDQIQLPIMHQGQKSKYSSHLEITVGDYLKMETLTCDATNTASQVTISATTNLTVIDPFSAFPSSQAPPVADKSFSLQCVGTENPASITWFKDKQPILPSERVNFSPDNVTVTFNPLLQTDNGFYQCVVAQGGSPIQSVPYEMQVIYGPSLVVITGVDIGTAGKMYNFHCSASCYPACQFTWTWGNETSHGPELSLQLEELHLTENLTCTGVNPATGMSVTAQKTLEVTAGPSNVLINGSTFLVLGVASSFSCSADCYPSCSYTWTVVSENKTLSTARGNTISLTPAGTAVSETLICRAEDTNSHLAISTNVKLWVARLSDIAISGTSTVASGKRYTYTCLAMCIPSCTFAWKYMGKTFQGDQIQILILPDRGDLNKNYSKTEPLTCEATNTVSQASISVTENLTVSEGPNNVVISGPDSLQIGVTASFSCSADCFPSCSFTWFLYGRSVTGRMIDITVNRHIAEEFISCQAENTVSGTTATANEMLSVSDPLWCGC